MAPLTLTDGQQIIDGPRHSLLAREFDNVHAAGVTRYRVNRHHRDVGYYECVAIEAVSGTHTTIGAIEVFSTYWINRCLREASVCDCEESKPHMCQKRLCAFCKRPLPVRQSDCRDTGTAALPADAREAERP